MEISELVSLDIAKCTYSECGYTSFCDLIKVIRVEQNLFHLAEVFHKPEIGAAVKLSTIE